MPTRNCALLVAVAVCAWLVGFFMRGPDYTVQRDASGTRNETSLPSTALDAAEPGPRDGPAGGAPSHFTFADRLKAVGGNPSSRWRREQLERLAEQVAVRDIRQLVQQVDVQFSPDAEEILPLLFARWA